MQSPNQWPPRGTREFLLAAAELLYEDDPEHFEGGCGDVTEALAGFAALLGLPGVVPEFGTAAKAYRSWDEDLQAWEHHPARTVFHAWMRVDGRVLDPTWHVVFGRGGTKYQKVMAARDMLVCSMDEPWFRWSQYDLLHRGLLASGWPLPPLPRRPRSAQ